MASRRPGVWTEIGIGLALVTLAAILLNGAVMWLAFRQAAVERDTDAAILASALLSSAFDTLATEDYPAALQRIQDRALEVGTIRLFDGQGKAIGSGPAEVAFPAIARMAFHSRIPQIEQGPDRITVYTSIPTERTPSAVLEVAIPHDLGGVSFVSTGTLLAYTAFTSAIVAAFGAILLQRGIVGPLLALREATARIASGDFTRQLQVEGSRELQELAGSLEAMSRSLQGYREDKERQVDELTRANSELVQAQEAVIRSERMATVGHLAAGIAHELGNPLAAVSGYVDLLVLGVDDAAAADAPSGRGGGTSDVQSQLAAADAPSGRGGGQSKELLERAQREIDRMTRIIRQLLDFARPSPPVSEAFDCRETMEEAIRTVAPIARFKDVRITLDVPDAPVEIVFERDRLHQVLVNLLLNAADALQAKGGNIVLRISRDEHTVRITSEDDGPGFSTEALARATEPFYTTKEVGAGTGLGLAVSSQLVRAAGGSLTVANRMGGPGAAVTVAFPRAPA